MKTSSVAKYFESTNGEIFLKPNRYLTNEQISNRIVRSLLDDGFQAKIIRMREKVNNVEEWKIILSKKF